MIDTEGLKRLLNPIKRKIFLMIGRALLTAIDNGGSVQRVQVQGLKGEVLSDIDHVQPYGFATYPESGKEVILIFVNGDRDQGVALSVVDRDTRPTDLAEGDSCLYNSSSVRVWLKAGGVYVDSASGEIVLKTGDASPWLPNVLPKCPLLGIPHGGPDAGIIKLKGE